MFNGSGYATLDILHIYRGVFGNQVGGGGGNPIFFFGGGRQFNLLGAMKKSFYGQFPLFPCFPLFPPFPIISLFFPFSPTFVHISIFLLFFFIVFFGGGSKISLLNTPLHRYISQGNGIWPRGPSAHLSCGTCILEHTLCDTAGIVSY